MKLANCLLHLDMYLGMIRNTFVAKRTLDYESLVIVVKHQHGLNTEKKS